MDDQRIAEIAEDAAALLDQVFRQPHTFADVEAEVKQAIRTALRESGEDAARQWVPKELTESMRAAHEAFINKHRSGITSLLYAQELWDDLLAAARESA